MAESKASVASLAAAAILGAGACSSAFVGGNGVVASSSAAQSTVLSASQTAPVDQPASSIGSVCFGVAGVLVAATATVGRTRVARKAGPPGAGTKGDTDSIKSLAIAKSKLGPFIRHSSVGYKDADGPFAYGLVGTELSQEKYDPLGLSQRPENQVAWFREAELKHGRVAMLGVLGMIAPDLFRIPIEPLNDPSINILNAHNKLLGPGLGEGPMWWVLIPCAVIESNRFRQLGLGFEKLTLKTAGDCGFGYGFMPKTEEGLIQMQIKELKNGRLAMLAFGGMITQAALPGHSPHFPFV